MRARLVEPGTVLADRYLIEDMLPEEGPADSWRAHDQLLARSVVLQLLPSSSPYAERLLAAAKRASRVADTRILQVLDAVTDGDLAYVVREWSTGQSLDLLLTDGPLPSRRAAWLSRELAGAIGQAHALGVTHRRLAPDKVVITSSGGVKIIGMETLAALHDDVEVAAAELEDTVGLGRLLYACLTARWPGADCPALPSAPVEQGRLLLPRQVRAGVPRALNEICDRILSQPPRYGPPITTAADVKEHLTQLLGNDLPSTTGGMTAATRTHQAMPPPVDPPPALLPREGGAPPPAGPPPTPVARSSERRAQLRTTLIWIAVAALVVGVTLLAYLVGQQGTSREQRSPTLSSSPSVTTSQGTSPATSAQPVQIATARSFDPYPGSGDEHPELVALAYDGDRSTAWETLTYRGDPALAGLKDGVGLLLDLGRVQEVRSVRVELQGEGTTVELRAAPEEAAVAPAASAQDYRLVGTVADAGTTALFRLQQPVSTRYLLVWLTSLPPEGADTYRGRVAEVKVYG